MIHYCCRCGNACDCWTFDQTHGDVCDGCSDCGNEEPCLPDGTPIFKMRPSREERLQRFADAGIDTWEDYRGEK